MMCYKRVSTYTIYYTRQSHRPSYTRDISLLEYAGRTSLLLILNYKKDLRYMDNKSRRRSCIITMIRIVHRIDLRCHLISSRYKSFYPHDICYFTLQSLYYIYLSLTFDLIPSESHRENQR